MSNFTPKGPRHASTRSSDQVQECPYCHKHFPTVVEYVPQFERDEFDQVIRDETGAPKYKVKTSAVTAPTTKLSPNFDPEYETEYKAAAERARAEREHKAKHPKAEIIAKMAA